MKRHHTTLTRAHQVVVFGRQVALAAWRWIPVCWLLATWGHAQATIDLSLKLETSLGHNSNLFRNDAVALPTVEAGSETPAPAQQPVTATGARLNAVLVGVGIPLGSDTTRLILTSRLSQQTYSHTDALDHQPAEHTAQLAWRFSDFATGQVAIGHTKSAYAFDEFYSNLDLATRDWRSATLTLKATPSIEFPLQLASSRIAYQDQPVHGRLDAEQSSSTAAALYRSTTGSTAQVGLSQTRTTYPRRLQPDLTIGPQERNTDVFLELLWVYSIKTQATLRLTSRQRRYANDDTSSPRLALYRLAVAHTLSPMLRVDAQLWRQPVQTSETAIAYSIARGSGLGLTYTPSPKATFALQWQKESQRDELFADAPSQVLSNPDASRLSLRAQYNVTRGVNLFLEAGRESRVRRATQTAHQNVWRVGLEYSFENLPGADQRTRAATLPPALQ